MGRSGATGTGTPVLHLHLLGPLAAVCGGEPVALGGPRQRAVLARLLLARGEIVTIERLAEDVWAGTAPPSVVNTLQSYISLLRRALGDAGLLRREGPGYVASVPPEVVDADCFRAEVTDGIRLLPTDPRAALTALDRGLARWRGPALVEFADEPWANPTAVELTQRRQAALGARFDALLALGRHADAVGEIEVALEADPLSERLTAQLMVALYRGGRQADALRAYTRTRERLADELGLDPTPELVALERQILDHAPALAAPVSPDPITVVSPTPGPPRPAADNGADAPGRPPAPADGATPSPVPLPRAALRADRTAFVGRADLLDALQRQWDDCAAGGRHLVVVRGEPGIGKSALAGRFAALAHAQGGIVLWGRATPHGVVPYEPVVEAISTALRAVSAEARARAITDRPALSVLAPDLATFDAGVAREAVDEATSRFLLFETVADLLDAESSAHPYVLVIDDLQWADASSLQMLEHVLRHQRPGRLLVVATMRSTPEESDDVLHAVLAVLNREGALTYLDVAGLDTDETRELLANHQWSHDDATSVHELTGGNPFFISELAARAPDSDGGRLPATVLEMIGQRLDRVGPTATRVLTAAAVAGPSVSLPLLVALTGLDGDDLLDAIDIAIAARLLTDDGQTGRLAFPHSLVRQAILQRISSFRRRGIHQRVAAAMTAIDAGPGTAPERAHHLFEAGDLVPVATRISGAIEAGRTAMAVHARDDALAWVDRAIGLGGGVVSDLAAAARAGVDVVALRLLECDAALALGDKQRARTAAAAAIAAARVHRSPTELAEAALAAARAVSGVGFDLGEVDPDNVAALEEAIHLLGTERPDLRVRLLAALTAALVDDEDHHRRSQLAAEARELAAAAGEPALVAAAQVATRLAAWRPDQLDVRLEAGRLALDAARRAGDVDLEFTTLLYRTRDLLESGRPDEARGAFRELETLTGRLHNVTYSVHTTFLRATYALESGRYDDAERLGSEAMAAGLAAHGLNAQHAYTGQMFCLAWDRGRLGEMAPFTEDFATRLPGMPVWQAAHAGALYEAGREDESEAVYRRLVDADGVHVRLDGLFLTTACFLVEVARAHRDGVGAAHLRAALEPYCGRVAVAGLGGLGLGPVTRYVGVACHLVGDLDAADRHLERAAGEASQMGARPYVARALRDRARVLADRGGAADRDLAGKLVADARAIADELGMVLRGVPDLAA